MPNQQVLFPEDVMDLLDRLLGHDAWTTRQLLELAGTLDEEAFDHEFDIGHRTLRRTFDHIISNMEIWSALMAEQTVTRNQDRSLTGLLDRLSRAAVQLETVSKRVAEANTWDQLWTDTLDDPPQQKTFGTAIAHVITHSMHHRAQVLYMLRRLNVKSVSEGDVFSWEAANHRK